MCMHIYSHTHNVFFCFFYLLKERMTCFFCGINEIAAERDTMVCLFIFRSRDVAECGNTKSIRPIKRIQIWSTHLHDRMSDEVSSLRRCQVCPWQGVSAEISEKLESKSSERLSPWLLKKKCYRVFINVSAKWEAHATKPPLDFNLKKGRKYLCNSYLDLFTSKGLRLRWMEWKDLLRNTATQFNNESPKLFLLFVWFIFLVSTWWHRNLGNLDIFSNTDVFFYNVFIFLL